jgi:hypothetical protein
MSIRCGPRSFTAFADHVPETEEYGVTSFVYRARRPFEPEKILAVLNGEMPGVIRAKGHFWIATRPEWVAEFSLAGALSSVKPLGTWWAAVPRERWPEHDSARAYIAQHWDEPWGDRRQEIVFIGAGIDWPALKARLDACLLPEHLAPGPDALPDLPDPFPWPMPKQHRSISSMPRMTQCQRASTWLRPHGSISGQMAAMPGR